MELGKISIAITRLWSLPLGKWIPLRLRTTSSLLKEGKLLGVRINLAKKDATARAEEFRKFIALNVASIRERGVLKPKDLENITRLQKAMHGRAWDSIHRGEKELERFNVIMGELHRRNK